MRKFFYGALSITLALSSIGPTWAATSTESITATAKENTITQEAISIELSDEKILVDGSAVSTKSGDAVYISHDIIYYEDKDTYSSGNPYGEGTDKDKHSAEEAAKHTVVNITKPGTYRISGKLSYGQIFVNVGKEDSDKVTLILDNVDITCSVAPAVFFYKVYECDADATIDTASSTVDTTNAGARVILADDSTNTINGSYVARILKDQTEEKKLHKYDGAFYSRMSMEIDGETKGNGVLNINAENEGLDSELHLTINGGKINIQSKDDGINVNEDGISVFTMNDGYLNIYAGNGTEGDGIDSNGWNVINGGTVISLANPKSMDGGIDSDKGSIINGGTVIGAGNMYDSLEDDSKQLFMFLQLAQKTDKLLTVTDEKDSPVFAFDFPNDYSYIVFSTPTLKEGTYHVYQGGDIKGTEENGFYSTITSYTKGSQLQHGGNANSRMTLSKSSMPNDLEVPPEGFNGEPPELPEGEQNTNHPTPPQGMADFSQPTPPNGEMPTPPKDQVADGNGNAPKGMSDSSELESTDFVLSQTSKNFTNLVSQTVQTQQATATQAKTTTTQPAQVSK